MKDETIPDEHHIARLCMPKTVSDGQIQTTAFFLRPNEEYLSVNWLEYFKCSSRENEIDEVRKAYITKLDVKPRAKIALLNVGKMHHNVRTKSEDSRDLKVLHLPEENDPSHSGIYNLKMDNELIAELILETVCDSYPART